MLNNFKIGTKLTLAFGIVILLLLSMTGYVIYSYQRISYSTENVLDMFGSANRAGECINHANQMRRHFLRYLATPDLELIRQFDEEFDLTEDIIKNVAANSPIPENQTEANQLLGVLAMIRANKDEFMQLEGVIDDIRTTCSGIAEGVRSELEAIGQELYAMYKSETVAGSNGDSLIRATDMELAAEFLRAQTLVAQVLQLRDNFVFSTVPERQEEYKSLLLAKMGELTYKLEEEIQRHPALPSEFVGRVNTIVENRIRWGNTAGNYIGTIEKQRGMQEPLLEALRDVMDRAGTIQDNVSRAAEATGESQHGLVKTSQLFSGGIALIAVIGAVLMGWILTISVATGIREAVGIMTAVADKGNVAIEIPKGSLQRGDEVGELASAVQGILTQFQNVEQLANDLAEGNYTAQTKIRGDLDTMNIYLNKMLDQVNQAMSEINDTVKQVATGSGEVSTAAQSLANGAQESAASLQQISASMSQMSSQVKENAKNATQARDLAMNANKAASEGQEAMHNMTSAMSRITENSNEIQRVIKVIDDIAFQTNLLALNAAVEAARAGQHGKGFAVVAEEVRNLASRSAKAARETSELIDKSSMEIEKGGEVAAKTAEVLNSIVEEIKQTTDLVSGIAVASNEQAEGVNQITIGLQQIDQVTQQNTATAEESASAANEMSGMATNLQNLIAKFKLRNHSRV
ncbi:MAG: methyl-accepting chemotaxis protein [Planctomycetaceae bacterium]|nr:methyl-accepting chemotaxis protein [Planctomycetaceae bacterium]